MRFFKKSGAFALIYGLILTCFTAYTLLDAFVIPRAITVIPQAMAAEAPPSASSTPVETVAPAETSEAQVTENAASEPSPAPTAAPAEPTVTDTSYSDENITVTITQYRENDTDIYVADVVLSSAEYLKTAFANSTYGRNVTAKTSAIADSVNAILAINGDYYGAQTRGYVIRGGVVYRDRSSGNSQEDLAIYADGSFKVVSEGDYTASELLSDGVYDLLSFGPGLVEDSEISVTSADEVDKSMTSNPRTAIGVIDDLHYVFVVSDGRTDQSCGLSLMELAEFMDGLGVETAYNLDGGGSSTMVFMGEVVNNPTTGGDKIKERKVSDIVCIAY